MTQALSALDSTSLAQLAVGGISAVGIGWAVTGYRVCKANEVMVKTGLGIKDVLLQKSGVVWPFQKGMKVELNPTTYQFQLHNMSKGKVEFELPVVMTIGPVRPENDNEGFLNYCKLLQDMTDEDIRQTVQGIIEGETRGLTAQLTVEEMFNGKDTFREKVVEKLAPDLNELGLRIYNANIQEMRDYDDNNKYFEYRKQRAIEMANNEARRDVAEAQKQGDVAVSLRSRDTRIALANNEKEAKVEEYARRKEILMAESEVAAQEAETERIRQLSLVVATQTVEAKRQELEKEVQQSKFQQLIEAERSLQLAPMMAQAQGKERVVDAEFYAKQKEAEGIRLVMEAKAEGMERLFNSCQGHPELAKFYLGVDSGLYKDVADASARAVQDMRPQITHWTTTGEGKDLSTVLTGMVQGLVPMVKQVREHLK